MQFTADAHKKKNSIWRVKTNENLYKFHIYLLVVSNLKLFLIKKMIRKSSGIMQINISQYQNH